MRFRLRCVAVLFVLAAAAASADEPPKTDDPPPLYSEKSAISAIRVERLGPFDHLIVSNTLWGKQFNNTFSRHWMDDVAFIVPGSPWDILAVAGGNAAYDPRQDPLSYFHRSGPVGAIFRELRTRKKGADAIAPVAILGLAAGTEAAYANKGQKFTYYETDPALKRLTADSDKYFTYIRDARKRGAEIEVTIGNRREKLKADKDRKYALILVDQAESFPVPRDVFSKEAVQLYFDRLTRDGIVALHISSKYLFLEPMIAQLADELKLDARIWYDNEERLYPGKNASCWVVLAKSETALGTIALPEQRQFEEYPSKFQRLKRIAGIPVWTDSHAEVLGIMFGPEIHRIRGHFGLPTPYRGERPW